MPVSSFWTEAPFNPGSNSSSNWTPDKEGWGNPSFDKYGIGSASKESSSSFDKWRTALDLGSRFLQSRQQQQQTSPTGISSGGGGVQPIFGDGTMSAVYPMLSYQPQSSGSSSKAGGIIGGALSGAAAGSALGPIGAIGGGILGAASGWLS